MQIKTFGSNNPNTVEAFGELGASVTSGGDAPCFVFAAVNAAHDPHLVHGALTALGGANIHVSSSCLGSMTDAGDLTQNGAGIAVFSIKDPDGDYGTDFQSTDRNPRKAAQRATQRALEKADRPGEIPDVIWVTATPGQEEAILAGIEDVVGTEVPIIGGSAADNSVQGDWYVMSLDQSGHQGVVVSVLFPSTEVSYAFLNGYTPTEHTGTVTRIEGRRLFEIDGRPAMDVYADWTGGTFSTPATGTTDNILPQATLWPMGREVSRVQGISNYLLAHPAAANDDGSIDLFADLTHGEKVTQMGGTTEALAERAGRVARQARPSHGGEIAGALTVYCGGCMLSIRDRMDVVLDGTKEALGAAPFLTHFSFGEQGRTLGGGNRHGNLMIACLVFSAPVSLS